MVPSPKFHWYVKPPAWTAGLMSVAEAEKAMEVPVDPVAGGAQADGWWNIIDCDGQRALCLWP